MKMPSTAIHGYAAKALGGSLEPFTAPLPDLGDSDVRVEVSHCGVCHTDIQAIDDYYEITEYPLVPGHEIVGHVSALGRETSGLKEGDRVGIGWQGRSCGHCEWCLKGQEPLCLKIVKSATWTPYGGFSNSVVADYRFVYPVPSGMLSEQAAVMMCAGITVYAPLSRMSASGARSVAILGVGGLGHLAIQFAHAFGHEVTAISSSPDKQEQALAFGADHFVLSERDNLRELVYAFDALLCTATGKMGWEALLDTLKKNGTLVLLGFPDVSFNSTDFVAHQLSMTSSFLGTHAEMRDMLSFVQQHAIQATVEVMPMSKVNEALRRVRENQARYRIVLAN